MQGGESNTDGNGGKADGAPGTALYIASLADELARLAKSHDLDALAYILDMARLEADQVAKHPPDWTGEEPQAVD